MKNPQNILPALIVALAVFAGLLVGAKIISNGVVEANRFQIIDSESFFDSATGGLFHMVAHRGWEPYSKNYNYGAPWINDVYDWVEYLEETKWELKDALKNF